MRIDGKIVSIFKNKHLMTASLVTPVLALIGYFGINALVGEKPHTAKEGESYQLVEMPNCRYDSGYCGLKNGEFELKISPQWTGDNQLILALKSEFPLDGVKVAVTGNEDEEEQPVDMKADAGDGLSWSVELVSDDPANDRLRLVASSRQSLYYGDVALKFTTR
jgi:hypothetical protein